MYLLSSAEGARAAVVGLHAASGEAASIIYYIYLSFVKFLYTVPGDGLKSVPIVTFFNDPYLFNG